MKPLLAALAAPLLVLCACGAGPSAPAAGSAPAAAGATPASAPGPRATSASAGQATSAPAGALTSAVADGGREVATGSNQPSSSAGSTAAPGNLVPPRAATTGAAAVGSTAASADVTGSGAARPPVAASTGTGTVPSFSHVFIVVEENTDLQTVLASGRAPTFAALAKQGAVAANYYAISHPSEPNYIALIGGDLFGVNSDSLATRIDAPTIVNQLEAANKSWKAYMEGLPAAGSLVGQAGNYAKKHDPFVLFTSITEDANRVSHVVPLTQLDQDLAANQVPDYSFIAPDLCHDMHDCGVDQGDPFLATLSTAIQGSKAWDSKAVLFVTFDEAEGQDASATCCGSLPGGGKVGLIAVSPLARAGYTSQQPYNHYSLLRTVEDAWRLGPLAHSGDPGVQPLADLFQ